MKIIHVTLLTALFLAAEVTATREKTSPITSVHSKVFDG